LLSLVLAASVVLDATALSQTSATLNALGPHPFGSPRNRAAAQFVAATLQDAGVAQTTVEDFVFEGVSGTNVVASIPGRSDRLLIIATHHDTRKDGLEVQARSRSLALLIEIGRQASRLRPERTWILASFDGGESSGEGLAHYLESLGKNRASVDGVFFIDASAALDASKAPALIAPACSGGGASEPRALASRDLVDAALGGVPSSVEVSFDDPGINLLTQPFVRAFRTACAPLSARALAQGIGVIVASDTSYSRRFLNPRPTSAQTDAPARDVGAARLGEVAFAAIQGIDRTHFTLPSDSWLVTGRLVLPGFVVFLLGLATLLPGLVAVRAEKRMKVGLRIAHAATYGVTLFYEPEIALFALALPNLVPPSWPRKYLTLALLPFAVLLAAGAFCMARGQVTGSWLSIWIWAGLLGTIAWLYASGSAGKKTPARAKRGKR
jgi:hypothetical protein